MGGKRAQTFSHIWEVWGVDCAGGRNGPELSVNTQQLRSFTSL